MWKICRHGSLFFCKERYQIFVLVSGDRRTRFLNIKILCLPGEQNELDQAENFKASFCCLSAEIPTIEQLHACLNEVCAAPCVSRKRYKEIFFFFFSFLSWSVFPLATPSYFFLKPAGFPFLNGKRLRGALVLQLWVIESM